VITQSIEDNKTDNLIIQNVSLNRRYLMLY